MYRNDLLDGEDAVSITPNDGTALKLRGIYVGGAGSVVITTASGDQTVTAVAGLKLMLPIYAVKATGTTATGILGFL